MVVVIVFSGFSVYRGICPDVPGVPANILSALLVFVLRCRAAAAFFAIFFLILYLIDCSLFGDGGAAAGGLNVAAAFIISTFLTNPKFMS